MPHEIDRLRQLFELAFQLLAISINRTVKAGGNGGAKSRWREPNNVLRTQMRDKIVPDRLGFRISVDKNDGHLCVLSLASRCLYERGSDGDRGHSPEGFLKWN
jgi:hypothetical protein